MGLHLNDNRLGVPLAWAAWRDGGSIQREIEGLAALAHLVGDWLREDFEIVNSGGERRLSAAVSVGAIEIDETDRSRHPNKLKGNRMSSDQFALPIVFGET